MLSATVTRRKWVDSFARLLREERQLAHVNIEDCPKRGNYQEECETTKRVPDLKYLIRLLMWFEYKRGYQISPARLRQLLILWALARIESVVKNRKFQTEVEGDTYVEDSSTLKFADVWTKYGSKVFAHLENTLIPIYEGLTAKPDRVSPKPPPGKLPTLDMFPDAFDPLTVVVGGRTGPATREPERLSELFRQGQSLIDLSYLLRLGLTRNVRIIPDETLIDMPINQRTDELGRSHLLIIGGPLVNSLLRYIALKKKLIFNCVYGNDTYRWKEIYDRFKGTGLFDNPSAVRMLYRMMETPQDDIDLYKEPFADTGVGLSERNRIKELVAEVRYELLKNSDARNEDVTEQFRPLALFSPLQPKLIPCAKDQDHDFAILSLGENPWAEALRIHAKEHPRFAVIGAFGSHELSTALAIKALCKFKEVQMRPLGGVLTITAARVIGPERVDESFYDWLTKPYKTQEVLERINTAPPPESDPNGAFSIFSGEELNHYRSMTEAFVHRES